jgi:hypothetical protein
MPIETEVEHVESAVINEIEKVEAPVVAKVDDLKTEVVEEVKKATTWAAKKLDDIKLKDTDKLLFSELENAFLREQLKLNEAVANIAKMRENAGKMIAGFAQTYGIDPAKHVFSDAERAFKAL